MRRSVGRGAGFGVGRLRRGVVLLVGAATAFAGATAVRASEAGATPSAQSVYAFGDAAFYGSAAPPAAHPVVGLASSASGHGYYEVGADGGIFSYGDAHFYGSTGAIHLNRPIVGIAVAPSGHGYWLVASDGGIFSFGGARFFGSTGSIHLNRPIVAMVPTLSGRGYWLVASDGGIFSFGDARFFGSTGGLHLNRTIVAMARTPSGRGYWLTASDGGIFTFGDAHFYGSTGALKLAQPITSIAATHTGRGYWLVARDGGIFGFGDARFHGSLAGANAYRPAVVGIAASRTGLGYWLAAAGAFVSTHSTLPPGSTSTSSTSTSSSSTTSSSTTSTSSSTTTSTTTAPGCDPSYPDVCIPPPPPVLTCADIAFRNFRVLAPDPDNFDPDHNGIGCPTGADWPTYGDGPMRQGQTTAETKIGTANAAGLHKLWSTHLGGVIIGQPMVAAGVVIGGQTRNVVYVGDESGHFAAIDESTGAILWEHTLATVTIANCTDVQNGQFGIGGAGLIDRHTNTVYIAASDGAVHAFDLVTGAEHAGWPVKGVFDPNETTSYGGISTDDGFTALYVQAASHCDFRPYHGSLTKIDVARHAISAVFTPSGSFDGGGIWGPGGASYDPSSHHLFVATGNAFTTPESFGYSEQVVELDGNLNVVGANYPGLTGNDVDFGATPILYQAPGCPVQVAAENKSGVLVVYDQGHLGDGPVQRLQLADVTDETFVGIPAYASATHTLYVADSSDSAPYTRGLVAFTVGSDCKLTEKWNDTLGPNKTPESPPTVANGVVYFGDGFGATEYAIDAASGTVLWNSGAVLDNSVYSAPTVVNGTLLVGTWGGTLYAFGP